MWKENKCFCFATLIIGAIACGSPKNVVLKSAEEGELSLKVDSVAFPGAMLFPILLKLTNNSTNKVALVFSPELKGFKFQVKNLYIVSGQDTFYLGIDSSEKYYVLEENTITPLIVYARFQEGKGYFNAVGQIESVFKNGRIVYHIANELLDDIALKEEFLKTDTLLIPRKLEASTGNAAIVREFLPGTFWLNEQSLNGN